MRIVKINTNKPLLKQLSLFCFVYLNLFLKVKCNSSKVIKNLQAYNFLTWKIALWNITFNTWPNQSIRLFRRMNFHQNFCS